VLTWLDLLVRSCNSVFGVRQGPASKVYVACPTLLVLDSNSTLLQIFLMSNVANTFSTNYLNLTFRGLWIVIYSYNKTNEMYWFLKFVFCTRTLHVSVRFSVHHQEFSAVYTAICICHTVSQFNYNEHVYTLLILPIFKISVWHMPIAVYTVLDSWWWTENLTEICRVPFLK